MAPPTLTPGEDRGAVLSPCGTTYRYRLWRTWDANRPACAFVMLNPSTADGGVDDPTVRRCRGFAQALGCGGFQVVNLYAYRAADPDRLAGFRGDPVGPDNDWHVGTAAVECPVVIAAWGQPPVKLRGVSLRISRILEIICRCGRTPQCLGRTARGFPRHPLFVRGDARPEPYHPGE